MFAGISGCIGMLVAGLVTKFINARRVFQIAYIITGSTVLLLTIKHDFNFLMALTFVFGFAQGSGTTTSNIIFLTLVNRNRRAVAFGWANFMTSLAIVVAPPFAGNFSASSLVFIYPFGSIYFFDEHASSKDGQILNWLPEQAFLPQSLSQISCTIAAKTSAFLNNTEK